MVRRLECFMGQCGYTHNRFALASVGRAIPGAVAVFFRVVYKILSATDGDTLYQSTLGVEDRGAGVSDVTV